MEQKLFFLINQCWTSPGMDWLMAVLTNWNFWMPFVLGASILLGIFGTFRVRVALVCAVVCVGIVDAVIVDHIKHLVGRPRPYMMVEGVREVELAHAKPRVLALTKPLQIRYSLPSIEPVQGPSFPSGHTANNFAVATVSLLFFRRWGWLFLIVATLVGYSRIYVGSHWPLDVLAAGLIGIGTALLLTAFVEGSWRRWGPRLFPRLASAHPSLLSSSSF
jgi:undecaprenyl-diphosphatase